MIIQRFFGTASWSLLLVGVISAQSADQPPELSSLSDTDLKTLTIRMERTACYGNCPAYTVIIHGDGRVEYSGKGNVKEKGIREGRVGPDAIKALAAEFAKAKFFTLSQDYSGKNCKRYCTDLPTAVTELTVRDVSHQVKHYYGCGGAPKALFELESAIDKLSDLELWTGDVSKAGPYGTTCLDRQ